MPRVTLILLIAGLITLAGCSRERIINQQREATLPKATTVQSHTAHVSLTMRIDDVVLERSDQNIDVTLTLTNHDNKPLNLTYSSGKKFDVLVRDARRKPLVRWSAGRAFTQVMQNVEVGPGESLSETLSVVIPIKYDNMTEGTYTVTGMTTGGVPLETRPLTVVYSPDRS